MTEDTDNLTKVCIDLPNHWWLKGESFWAKALGNDLFEIQNVPFCAYGLNCGDIVRAIASAPNLKPEIKEVVTRSGNETLRVSFVIEKEQQGPCIEAIEARGAWVERANSKFIAINIPPSADIDDVRDYLDEQEASGTLYYETCEERVAGSFDDKPEEPDTD